MHNLARLAGLSELAAGLAGLGCLNWAGWLGLPARQAGLPGWAVTVGFVGLLVFFLDWPLAPGCWYLLWFCSPRAI